MSFDDKYFDSYAISLLELPIEEFEKSLLNESQSGYIEFMHKILEHIFIEIRAYNEVSSSCTNPEDLEYLDSEIEKIHKMKEIVEEKINNISQVLPKHNFDIVFLKSEAGNPFIFRDLKTIPEEYYNSLFELFNELKSYDFSSGNITTKIKNMGSEKRFENILEFKTFKLRLYFKPISDNTLLLLQASYKTQTQSKLIKETLESRNILANKYVDKLKEDLSNEEKALDIKDENSKVEEELYQFLKQNKRGSK